MAATPVETIRSRQNSRLKDLRQRLLRPSYANDGLIAIEGEHLLLEALRSGLRIETLFLREDHSPGREDSSPAIIWPEIAGSQTFTVAGDVFDRTCMTESPQGIAAVVEMPQWSLDSLLNAEAPRLVILAGLQDPGNIGTIIRTAEAFAATGVLLTPGSVHPGNQKVLRASAGSSFRLPVILLEDIAVFGRLREQNIPILACLANGGAPIFDADLRGRFALVIGNEGAGIPDEVVSFCSSAIQIPCPGPVESLNAGVAASIILYEASRQRKAAFIGDKP